MSPLVGIAGLLLVALITPGPNNLIVMNAAARAGWRAALRAGAGIVTGSVTLLAMVAAGVGSALDRQPRVATVMAAIGCLYLSLLGGRLIARSFGPGSRPATSRSGSPAGATGLFVFQFANPKAWITLSAVVASAESQLAATPALPLLAALLLLISIPSLAFWSSCGMLVTRRLERPRFRSWFDRAAGGLLLGSALLLIAGV